MLSAGITAFLLYNPNPLTVKRNEHYEYESPAEALRIIKGKSVCSRSLSS